MESQPRHQAYQLFVLGLCLFALVVLAVGTFFPLAPGTKQILDYADLAVCILFFGDFIYSLIRAPNKWRYLYTWGWIDLLSSIPMIPAFRVGRAMRILRILRVLRGIRATRILASFALERRAQSTFAVAAMVWILLIVFASIAILEFETTAEGNIKTGEDAIWWALTTVTTVGYGDRFPVTSEGRFVAALLMTAGIALFGIVSGIFASWFLAPSTRKQENETDDLRQEVRALRELIERRSGAGNSPGQE